MDKCFIFVISVLGVSKASIESTNTYSAVVVEYAPQQDPSVDGLTNILNNVKNYIEIISTAKSKYNVEIVVFPEGGLKGVGNKDCFLEVPDPKERISPCASNYTNAAALAQLSCAARATSTYVVVNLGEQFYNASLQRTVYYNTNVVFDINGTVIARYRKIHLFSEGKKEPSPNRELVYFDTEFGVRFGIFTCFDIVFEDPGVVLANEFNVTHFIFLSGWMSQLPFLVAIQEQHYWAYTQDVVLLVAGHNLPTIGASGTGVYLGRKGPLTYRMVDYSQSFMLHADVPKNYSSSGGNHHKVAEHEWENKRNIVLGEHSSHQLNIVKNFTGSQKKLKLKHEDFLNNYTTKLIRLPESYFEVSIANSITVPVTVEEEICQNSLCCQFTIKVTVVFDKTRKNIIRGDDYSQLFYRLAVFDGVRHYDYIATGGLQTCAIISCISPDITSCGLRSDEPSAQPNKINDFFQSQFIFESISITGNFSNNHSFVGPNVLLGGEGDSYGSLLPSENFIIKSTNSNVSSDTVVKSFHSVSPIRRLVTASLYGRLYLRDGLPSSVHRFSQQSSSRSYYMNFVVFITTTVLFKYLCFSLLI